MRMSERSADPELPSAPRPRGGPGGTGGSAPPPPEEGAADPAAERAMIETRSRFLLRNPFLGVLLLDLPLRASPRVRSISSDGTVLWYNPAFLRGAPPLLAEAHLLHAVLHWAFGHAARGAGRDPRRWQIACDLALVPVFLRSSYDYRTALPIRAPVELARDRSAEEIYGRLAPEEPAADPAPGEGPSDCWQEPAAGAAADRRLRQLWRERIVRAAQSADPSGPGGEVGREFLAAIGAPRVPWRAVLHRFLARTQTQDFSWLPPNRRYVARRLYLPGTRNRSFGDLVVAVDTSGSIDPETARGFLAEVEGIGELVAASGTVYVLQADDEVRQVAAWRRGTTVAIGVTGRGGTDFRPVFRFLAGPSRIETSGLIYLTDGNGPFPDQAPGYPVLWALTEEADVPFGERLRLPSAMADPGREASLDAGPALR